MKKNVNKLLLLFASLFIMTAVACSNPSGGGPSGGGTSDDGSGTPTGSDTPDTPPSTIPPETPEPTATTAPQQIEDNDYVGIKIKIKDIPANATGRDIIINDALVATDSFSTNADGSITVNQHVLEDEWAYPFVEAGKTYRVVVSFSDKNYQTIQTSKPLTITAESGLGELSCPNKQFKIEGNRLVFPKGSPTVYYKNNKTIDTYTNLIDTPYYLLEGFLSNWGDYYSWNELGHGAVLNYDNTFDLGRMKPTPDADKEYMFRIRFYFQDKDYGTYTYVIATDGETHFKLDPAYIPDDIINIADLYPTNGDIKGKYFISERNEGRFNIYELNPTETAGKVEGYLHKCLYNTTTDNYNCFDRLYLSYTDGFINIPDADDGYLIYINNKYYLTDPAYTFKRSSGSNLDSIFISSSKNITITLTSTGGFDAVYPDESGTLQNISYTYTNTNGIISSQGRDLFLYDGYALYQLEETLEPIQSLPSNYVYTGSTTTTVSPHLNFAERKPERKVLKGKVLYFETKTDENEPRHDYFQFANNDSYDESSPLSATMYSLGFDSNGDYTCNSSPEYYIYQDGILSDNNDRTSDFRVVYVNNHYYLSPSDVVYTRLVEHGLFSSFSYNGGKITLNENYDFVYNNDKVGSFENENGIITVTLNTNDSDPTYLIYDGEILYMAIPFIEAAYLPSVSIPSDPGQGD